MTNLECIVEFIRGIGLECRAGTVHGDTVLPGIAIEGEALVFDGGRLRHEGDLLHEAGHLAVMPPARRRQAHRTVGKFAAEEMMAIAWSYAACVHLQLDAAVVFHADGYRGESAALIENFTQGRYLAVPALQWLGMAADARRARSLGVAPYPAMIRWLNDGPLSIGEEH
ncbi:MAG: hypothetical protein HY289_02760 [Planctomycetes bacterium]|nr:hypothetical protein [Planctomycetota bacterium]